MCGAVSSAIFGWEPSWWVGQHMDGLDEWRLSLLSPYHTGSPRESVSSVSSKAAMEEIDTKGVCWQNQWVTNGPKICNLLDPRILVLPSYLLWVEQSSWQEQFEPD